MAFQPTLIENDHNFRDSCKCSLLWSSRSEHFSELADKTAECQCMRLEKKLVLVTVIRETGLDSTFGWQVSYCSDRSIRHSHSRNRRQHANPPLELAITSPGLVLIPHALEDEPQIALSNEVNLCQFTNTIVSGAAPTSRYWCAHLMKRSSALSVPVDEYAESYRYLACPA